ncbi:hypothetical protein AWC38_SpisGene7968 [Stylophora pistillata]|uniref:Uncharacterized protein n=1 Tax=Stylophora pistillata TaxID=50429 RepID=A0A2B4SFX0_STYPI|nr:hypothetical protein AWC38_SpisGene7968 [Stylophora pistillata]
MGGSPPKYYVNLRLIHGVLSCGLTETQYTSFRQAANIGSEVGKTFDTVLPRWLSSSIMGGSPPKYYVNLRLIHGVLSCGLTETQYTSFRQAANIGSEVGKTFDTGADMSWQSWAANELNQAATYPSPYANVHKGNMNTMGGSIGMGKDDTWKPYTMEIRTSNTEKVNKLENTFVSWVSLFASFRKDETEAQTNQQLALSKIVLMSQHGQLGMPFPIMQICCLQLIGWAMALSLCRLKRPNILE